jgi:serine O-acetyltransferase
MEMAGPGTRPRALAELRRDVRAARERDPAARDVSTFEILATWPGVQALLAHRISNGLQRRGVPLLPRLLAHVSRTLTGIEIHPAAEIGQGLFIDHGSGVVIGETARIGDDVTIYQGVTLGGTGFQVGKRHPTVGDRVTIGSGAKLLGPITVGDGAKVGANSVVITDVPPNATVVGNPGHPVRIDGRKVEGPDADWIHLPDPVADAVRALGRRVVELEQQVRDLGGSPAPAEPRDVDSSSSAAEPGAQIHELRPKQGRSPAGG